MFLFAFFPPPLFLFFLFFFPPTSAVNKQPSRLPRVENHVGKCRSWCQACTVSVDDRRRAIYVKRSRLLLSDLVSSTCLLSHLPGSSPHYFLICSASALHPGDGFFHNDKTVWRYLTNRHVYQSAPKWSPIPMEPGTMISPADSKFSPKHSSFPGLGESPKNISRS